MDENARVIELLTEISEKLGGSSVGNLAKQAEVAAKGLEGEAKQRKINEVMVKQTTEALTIFDKAVKKGRKSLIDLGPVIDQFEDSLEEMTDGLEKSEVEQKRNALASQYLTAQYKKSAADISFAVGKVLVGGIGKTAGGLVRSLQDNASGTAIAGEVLTNAIDMAQSGFSTVARGGQALGTTLAMSTNPRVRMFGMVTAVASTALEGITSTLSDLAKFGIQVMVKEVEKTIKTFNEITAAGALFTGGIVGVRNAAADAGFTVEQFSNVIKTNSQALGETGLGVTAAATRMGQVGKIIKSSGVEEGLMKLGFGFEEQAGLIAETMASMRRSGILGTATNAQIAEATDRYAKNLRLIAELTGKDAAAAMKEAQAKNTQYAFDAKIREDIRNMGLTGQDAANYKASIDAFVATLVASGQDVTGFQQQFVTGANTMAGDHLTGMTEFYKVAIGEFRRGNTDTADVLSKANRTIAGAADAISYRMGAEIGTATLMMQGADATITQAYEAQRNLATFLKNEPTEIRDAIEARAKEQSKVTENLINAQKNAQRLRIEQEMILTGQLAEFASVVDGILENLRETVEKYMGQFAKQERTLMDAAKHIIGTGLNYGLTGIAAGAILSAPTAGTIAPVTATAGGIIGGAAGVTQGLFDVYRGEYADGGIVHRPEVALIGEGGNSEAVVPLPDNRSIPVTLTNNQTNSSPMDTKEIVSAINQQTGMLTRILVSMEKNNQLTSGILQTSY